VKHLPQLVGGRAINYPALAAIGYLTKQQLATAIAVGINRVDQFETRRDVEMVFVGYSRIDLVKVLVDVWILHEHDQMLHLSFYWGKRSTRWWRWHVGFGAEHHDRLIVGPQVVSLHLHVLEDRIFHLRRSRGPVRGLCSRRFRSD